MYGVIRKSCPFRCCFAGSLPFSLSTVKQTNLFHSISEKFFTFLARKTLWVKLFSLIVLRSGAASCNERREFWRETLTPLWLRIGFWLDVSFFFSHMKKHRSRFWLDVSFFSRVKTIVRCSDWLELICVEKYFSVCISSRIFRNRTVGLLEPTHLKLTQLK